jgi:hypothetical protein
MKTTLPPKFATDLGAISMTQQIAKPKSNSVWLVAVVLIVLGAGAFSFSQLRAGPAPVVLQEAVVDASVAEVAVAVSAPEVTPPEVALDEVDAGLAVAEEVVAPTKASVLFADVDPPCDITVDGTSYGRLPELELMPGKHTIVLANKPLGFTRKIFVDLKAGDRKPLKLRAGKGTVEVSIVPYGELRVDGEVVSAGTSYKELTLWDGPHQLEAVVDDGAGGKKRKKLMVEVKRDASQKATINLIE